MNIAEIKSQGDGVFAVTGNIDFSTVNQLLAQSEVLFATNELITLDLTLVQRANSAGLALLLEWQDRARMQKRLLRIRNVPSVLIDIARISNCVTILNLIDN